MQDKSTDPIIPPGMSPGQLENYREGEVFWVSEHELTVVWANSSAINPDGIQLGVFRCPVGTQETCEQNGCAPDDCGCCQSDTLYESALNVPGWDVPECGDCGRPVILVECSGVWADVKDDPKRLLEAGA